jgi:hypothetical protein
MSIPPASAAPGMPSSSIPLPDQRERLRRGVRAAVAAAVLILGMLAAVSARADVIVVKSAELRAEEDGYYLNAEFEFSLNSTLDEALQKGVPLYFLLEFEISRPRWYWLDEKVVSATTQYRVSYNALTRQYRIASGLLGLTFESLDEVERFLSRVTAREVARRDQLAKGTRYEAALRLRLDVNQLPKPFQMSALASREWTLASDWYRWSFTP